jgi:hypothetical protein
LIAGRAALAQGRREAALALLQTALDLREHALLPASPRVAQARAALEEAKASH